MNEPRGTATTTYAVNDGKMSFFLPNRRQHNVLACKVDHPRTMCTVLDMISQMTPYERRSVILIAAEIEMESMYPPCKRHEE